MQATNYKGVEIDVCPECIAVWLDDSELADIVTDQGRQWSPGLVEKILEITGGLGIPGDELKRVMPCPTCRQQLRPVNYQGTSGVIVNTCDSGHGVWLDAGELANLQIYVQHWQKKKKPST